MLVIHVTTSNVINITNNLNIYNIENLTLWLHAKNGLGFFTIVAIRQSKNLNSYYLCSILSIALCSTTCHFPNLACFNPEDGRTFL
jgi:hypothetical protein